MGKIEFTCIQCNKLFYLFPSEIKKGRGKYCSHRCYTDSLKRRETFTCLICGKSFERQLGELKRRQGKYCSYECSNKGRANKVEVECPICGKISVKKMSQITKGAACCSKKCAATVVGIRISGENSPLWKGGKKDGRGANWRLQRRLARIRDGGVCQVCGYKPKRGEPLNVIHHIKPYREFNGDYLSANDLLNLITLCKHCHPKAEWGQIPVPKRLL